MTAAGRLTVSVVVPVYNAARTLDGCLAALAAQARPPDELILVDNGSTDGSVERLEAFARSGRAAGRVLVLREPRRGAAAARNAGIARASGCVVAFTDADCRPRPDWLERLLAGFDAGEGGAGSGARRGAAAGGEAGRAAAGAAGDREVDPPGGAGRQDGAGPEGGTGPQDGAGRRGEAARQRGAGRQPEGSREGLADRKGEGGGAAGAVAGAVVAAPAAGLVEEFCGLFTLRSGRRPERHMRLALRRGGFPGGFPTANLAVRRDLLLRVGGFDTALSTYGEDYDLCARLYAAGASLRVCPDAVVEHVHRDSLLALLRQAHGVGASHARLLRRHAPGTLLVDFPRASLRREGAPLPAWVDLAGADKGLAAIAALGLLHPAAFALVPLHALRLFAAVSRAAREEGRRCPAGRRWAMAGLLLLRSAALTAGRLRGAMRERVLCV